MTWTQIPNSRRLKLQCFARMNCWWAAHKILWIVFSEHFQLEHCVLSMRGWSSCSIFTGTIEIACSIVTVLLLTFRSFYLFFHLLILDFLVHVLTGSSSCAFPADGLVSLHLIQSFAHSILMTVVCSSLHDWYEFQFEKSCSHPEAGMPLWKWKFPFSLEIRNAFQRIRFVLRIQSQTEILSTRSLLRRSIGSLPLQLAVANCGRFWILSIRTIAPPCHKDSSR